MSTITRFIPNTHVKRLQVLNDAFNQIASTPVDNIFSTATTTRINATKPDFEGKMDTVRVAEEALGTLSSQKEETFGQLQMVCSHFIQVFNFAVDRGVFTKDDRLYYGLDKETGKLPPMITEDDLKEVAHNLITGEAERILDGGAPMTNPAIADVSLLATSFNTLVTNHQTAALVLIDAQSRVNSLAVEADKVIKKIYDEAETIYNELDAPAQREACRQWGVIYTTVGDNTLVTVQVNHPGGAPHAGVEVKMVEAAGKKLITNAEGQVVFDTKVVNEATLELRLIPSSETTANVTRIIEIEETVPMTVVIEL